MKKASNLLVFNIFLSLLLFSACNDSSNSNSSSITNSDDNNKTSIEPDIGTNSEPVIGPGKEQEDDNNPNDSLNPILASYNSSISHGETNVEVNIPITITFNQDINHHSVTLKSFYLKNSHGFIIYSRIIRDNRTFILIPRIPLQPGRTYTVVMKGLNNTKGRTIKTIKISYTNRDLDFGLYWFGKNGQCEKYFPDIENAYYDDEKSTVIYAHGFEAGITLQKDVYGRRGFKRETFFFKENKFNGAKEHNGLKINVNHSWIDAGWNTGMIFWNQFADDIDLWGAEAKIWTFNSSRRARYMYLKKNGMGEYREWDRKIILKGKMRYVKSIGELFSIYLLEALKNNISGNLRLVGHSLGNQVVCRLTKQFFNNNRTVNRVALLDPAWTNFSKDYLDDLDGNDESDWVGERCRKILLDVIEKQGNKFAVEIYHTTGLNLGIPVVDDNVPLTSKVCDVNILPWYYNAVQLHPKHMVIRHHYFWSYASPPPIECTKNLGTCKKTGIGPSASTSTEDIIKMMNEKYEWSQVEGTNTPNPSDDKFEKKKKETGFFGSVL